MTISLSTAPPLVVKAELTRIAQLPGTSFAVREARIGAMQSLQTLERGVAPTRAETAVVDETLKLGETIMADVIPPALERAVAERSEYDASLSAGASPPVILGQFYSTSDQRVAPSVILGQSYSTSEAPESSTGTPQRVAPPTALTAPTTTRAVATPTLRLPQFADPEPIYGDVSGDPGDLWLEPDTDPDDREPYDDWESYDDLDSASGYDPSAGIEGEGRGTSTGTKLAIGAGVAAVLAGVLYLTTRK